ncbi:MAG: NYN domain-containing protein [Gammaproteobacteria bacterium]|nr:NYN domain-containing protein [Gammaproteobacteria bacterium]
MNFPFSRAPHIEGASAAPQSGGSTNAALLIDFDNVTMGIRSDLSKELRTLLDSDVIRGKVSVQRAYADWRRYPQYIVPLSKASIDLIFAPAYGSSKKNATDIRMAIDGIELVFTRPEIGTFILLTGDSDFSSLVLKLKEYGKYVIGVGMQESSSDILVQNCDEYYSYTSLSGLTKAVEGTGAPIDPWKLVGQAVEEMGRRGDAMRSDRLKQVMMDLDPVFSEKALGFSKFSKFMTEAAGRGIVEIQRLENGQFEILVPAQGKRTHSRPQGRRATDAGKADGQRSRRRGKPAERRSEPAVADGKGTAAPTLEAAYGLLQAAAADLLRDTDGNSVRDSDVKRRMLALKRGFSEGSLGFSKFSKFLRQAEADGVIRLQALEDGVLQVSPVPATGVSDPESLGLPTGRGPVIKYLSSSYAGVGKRTAETLVDALGDDLFHQLETNPSRVGELLPPGRAGQVLAAWRADYERRTARLGEAGGGDEPPVAVVAPEVASGGAAEDAKPRPRRGRRTRRRDRPSD